MIWETATSEHYPELDELVYAPKWYYKNKVKKDEYSARLWFSKEEEKAWYFTQHLEGLIKEMKAEKVVDFSNIELITIMPRHIPGVYSLTLDPLAILLSNILGVKYEKILERAKDTWLDGKRPKEALQRYTLVKDSLIISRKLTEKKVLLFDDIKTTGTDILEAKKILLNAGVRHTITICLGINTVRNQESESMISIDEKGEKWKRVN
jgi:hypothetical protein